MSRGAGAAGFVLTVSVLNALADRGAFERQEVVELIDGALLDLERHQAKISTADLPMWRAAQVVLRELLPVVRGRLTV